VLRNCVVIAMASTNDNSMRKKVYSMQITIDGTLCYYEDFSDFEGGHMNEPLLVTGLLCAMAALVREITKKGVLRKIESPPVKFYALQTMETPQIILSMFTDVTFPDYICDIILSEISQYFLEKYIGTVISWAGENLTSELSPRIRKTIDEDCEKYSMRQQLQEERMGVEDITA
jgi:hypothetical protein